jgi:hypothetical protein
MLILAALFLIGVITEFWAIAAAPFGYQDETGFHSGNQSAGDDSRTSDASLS